MVKEIEITLDQIKKYVHALHCPTRWKIILFLREVKNPREKIASTWKANSNGKSIE